MITESHQDDINKRVFECFYQSSPSISDSYLSVAFFKTRPNYVYQILGGRLIGVETIGELSLGRPKGGSGRLIEVVP